MELEGSGGELWLKIFYRLSSDKLDVSTCSIISFQTCLNSESF